MLIQVGLNLFSGEPSESIKLFGKSLGAYLQQISEFLSYASEEKPFPFSDWPEALVIQPEMAAVKVNTDSDAKPSNDMYVKSEEVLSNTDIKDNKA